MALRTVQLTESLWLDELHTAWVVADGLEDVCPRAGIGNQGPVYFLLAWLTTLVGGLNEVALRMPSVIAGVGLVVLAFYVAREWTGRLGRQSKIRGGGPNVSYRSAVQNHSRWSFRFLDKFAILDASNAAGLLAALLVTVDRNCVFYAQEARPYALVQLLGLAHVFLFQRQVFRPNTRRRIALIALGVLLFYVHYTSIILMLGEGVYYALLHTRSRWRSAYHWRQYLLDMSVLALCLLPAAWHLAEIAARRGNWAMFIDQGPWWKMWYIFPLNAYIAIPLAFLAASYVVAWLYAVWSNRRRRPGGPSTDRRLRPSVDVRDVLLTACWLFVPLLVTWSLTACDIVRLFFVRYVAVCIVAPITFAAVCVAACPSRIFRAACALVVTWGVVYQGGMVWQYHRDGRVIGDRNQDWRSAVAAINTSPLGPATPVFVRSGLIEAEGLRDSDDPRLRVYCLLPVRGIYRLQQDDEDLIPLPTTRSGRLTPTHRHRIIDNSTAWFLLLGTPETVGYVEAELLARWPKRGGKPVVVERHKFGAVAVLRIEVATKESRTRKTSEPLSVAK